MAGFFKKVIKKVNNFLFDVVEIDEDGNEIIIENDIETIIPSRIDSTPVYDVKREVNLKKDENKLKINDQPIEKDIVSKTVETTIEETATKKTSMFVDFNNLKSDISEIKTENENKKIQSDYVPQKVISPIFGSDKDSYTISINNLEYDSDKPRKSVIGTIFSPIFGSERIIEDVADEVDEKIASMKTSDFISDDVKPENKEDLQLFDEEIEPPKPLYKKLKVEEKPITYSEDKTIENISLFDAERVSKTLSEAKVTIEEIEKAAKPAEQRASYENISLFD
ncbi:MAG: hypothetical protein ACOX1F_05140 [Erysipelotrichaceae bacterium]|jgi:6-pyruvoyl-tetrahydropterin synthase